MSRSARPRARTVSGAFAGATIAILIMSATPASAQQGCGGGPLSTSSGNLVGSAVGAVAGGVLGNQFGRGSGKGVMTGVGVVGGALAGGYAGRSIECNSAQQAQPAPAAAAGGYQGSPAAYSGAGRQCRYVVSQATINGALQQVNGVACLAPDGTWQLASDPGAQSAAQYDLVLRSQQQLRQQGFYERNNIDGRWGPATSSAVRNFQQAHGMMASGELDQPTQMALGVAPGPVQASAVPPPPPNAPDPNATQVKATQ